MDTNTIKFGDTEIEKYKFHQHNSPLSIVSVDICKIVVPNKVSFGKKDFKYFIGFKYSKANRALSIILTKMSAYRRDFVNTKCKSFLAKDEKLLEKYNDIWKKVINIVRKI